MKMGNDKNLQVICKGSLHAFSVTTFTVEEINLIFGNTFAHIHTHPQIQILNVHFTRHRCLLLFLSIP